jgi:hypothetical protein
LSYTHRNSAGQPGTNRTTQAEISSEFWLSFPVQVTGRNLQRILAQFPGAGQISSTHKTSRYFSIFKLILNWFLLSNELIVFTALFLPLFSAQIS